VPTIGDARRARVARDLSSDDAALDYSNSQLESLRLSFPLPRIQGKTIRREMLRLRTLTFGAPPPRAPIFGGADDEERATMVVELARNGDKHAYAVLCEIAYFIESNSTMPPT
jgi:hypothetical protein